MTSEELIAAVESFARDELAYLALTSRLERPFVDRLSFALHQRFSTAGLSVAREWPIPNSMSRVRARADIALLRRDKAEALVEAKAMHSFAPSLKRGANLKYVDRMQSDLDRLHGADLGKAQVYCLMLATHARAPVPDSAMSTVKYAGKINSCLVANGGEAKVREIANHKLRAAVMPGSVLKAGSFQGGHAFGIEVEALWWLLGPFPCDGDLRLRAV